MYKTFPPVTDDTCYSFLKLRENCEKPQFYRTKLNIILTVIYFKLTLINFTVVVNPVRLIMDCNATITTLFNEFYKNIIVNLKLSLIPIQVTFNSMKF